MPSPRFQHGFHHDVFVSYTHADNQPDRRGPWVERFEADLKARLEVVSGASIDIWWDKKLGAADRFNDAIKDELQKSAVLVVILSPSYFNSAYCQSERESFYTHCANSGQSAVGNKNRVVKVAKFFVPLEQYPPDLEEMLELRFYAPVAGTSRYRELHLHEDATVRDLYETRVDDVAQEIATILRSMEARAKTPSRGSVYLAEATSDLQEKREEIRRYLTQLGYEVTPRSELRLMRTTSDLQRFVTENLSQSKLAIHPVGALYGAVPEGANGKSVVQMQLDLAAQGNGNFSRMIWLPEGVVPLEDAQKSFLQRVHEEYPQRGFELIQGPLPSLTSHMQDRLDPKPSVTAPPRSAKGVYLICDNQDRGLAKTLRLALFNEKLEVEWTPLSAGDLSSDPQHRKLLERNQAHVIVYGNSGDGWLQDRLNELSGQTGPRAIFLADPRRDDKEDVLVRDIDLLEGYSPSIPMEALRPFIDKLKVGIVHGAAAPGGAR
jgi:hypothetical protein